MARARRAAGTRAARSRLARDPASAQVGARVLRLPADARLEVQVRPGAVARAAHVADHLALTHLRSLARREPRKVRVARRELARVGDADDVSVAALLPGHAHRPARRSPDRRAGRRRQVHAVVVASAARSERRALRPVHGRRDRRRAAAAVDRRPGLNRSRRRLRSGGGLRSGRGLRRRRRDLRRRTRGLDQSLLDPVAYPLRHIRAADRGLREQRPPGHRPDDAVDRQPGTALVGAHRRIGLRPEHAVRAHAERLLHLGHQRPLRSDHQRQPALAHLDGAVGRGLGRDSGLQVASCERGRRSGARPRHGRGDHRQRHPLASLLLAPQPRRQRAPPARSFERLLPEVSRSQVSLGERHPSCPLPFRPTGLADGLALEDALRGTASATRPERQMGPPFLASGRREDSALDLHYRNNPGEGKLRNHRSEPSGARNRRCASRWRDAAAWAACWPGSRARRRRSTAPAGR